MALLRGRLWAQAFLTATPTPTREIGAKSNSCTLVSFLVNKTSNMSSSSSATSSSSSPMLAAVVQLSCTSDKLENLSRATALVRRARHRGADLIFLPEAFDFVGESTQQTKQLSETIQDSSVIAAYSSLTKELKVALSLGGFHEKLGDGEDARVKNTHLLIDERGDLTGRYSKTHLFDVDVPGGPRLKESDYVVAGPDVGHPVAVGATKVGLGICYDMRFPEFSLALRRRGAHVLTFPSAFTVATGMAHWEALLRARAIETQCYVAAAAQCGKHNQKRSSYGHSMIVDPWGAVVAQCGDGEGLAMAEINLDYVDSVRRSMPVLDHRRSDLYGLAVVGERATEEQNSYPFGDRATISKDSLVLSTRLSLVTVNRKPVVPGHLLALPKRKGAVRMADLAVEEAADLFQCVRRAQAAAEAHFGCSSSTVSVQDGADAGRTVEHLHVHVLPRKKGDFEQNDDVYKQLDSHDKDVKDSEWRSQEEMDREAAEIRETIDRLRL